METTPKFVETTPESVEITPNFVATTHDRVQTTDDSVSMTDSFAETTDTPVPSTHDSDLPTKRSLASTNGRPFPSRGFDERLVGMELLQRLKVGFNVFQLLRLQHQSKRRHR